MSSLFHRVDSSLMGLRLKRFSGKFAASMLILLQMFIGESAIGHGYDVRLDSAQWIVEPSRLECRLSQWIPNYGRAVFAQRAGESQRFFLNSKRKVISKENARLESAPPAWIHNKKAYELATVPASIGRMPLKVDHHLSTLLVEVLEKGLSPRITHAGFRQGHKVHVEILAVNFMEAFQNYLDCIAMLLPHNFDQLERTIVMFDSGKTFIRRNFKERMNELAHYSTYDPEVAYFVVDGHTDTIGRTGANWDLSRMRAERVKDYLLSIGVDEEMIIVRYHGETRLKVREKGSRDRAKNRRVTIRLERKVPVPGKI